VIPSNFITVIHRLNAIGKNAVDGRKFKSNPAKLRRGPGPGLRKQKASSPRGLTRQASSDYLNGRRLSGA
jgi:hypothetical protein